MGYIYIIKNDINEMKYIGLTTRTVKKRWQEHKKDSLLEETKKPLYLAMKKYGIEHFQIATLGEYENEDLPLKEKEWISFFDSYNNGYNATSGGEGVRKNNSETIISLWEQGYTLQDIADELKITKKSVSSLLQKHDLLGDLRIRKICQYSLEGKFIRYWDAITEAANEYNCSIQNIERAINDYRQSARGFLWERAEEESKIKERVAIFNEKTDPRKLAIKQYTLQGEYIQTFSCTGEAAKFLNTDRTAIHHAVKNRYTSNGYVWLYETDDESLVSQIIERNKTKHDCKKKPVKQYSLEGEYIATYPSAQDAANALGKEKKIPIQRTCQGHQTTAYGYKWSY